MSIWAYVLLVLGLPECEQCGMSCVVPQSSSSPHTTSHPTAAHLSQGWVQAQILKLDVLCKISTGN